MVKGRLLGICIGNRLLEAQIQMKRNIINGGNIIISINAQMIKDINHINFYIIGSSGLMSRLVNDIQIFCAICAMVFSFKRRTCLCAITPQKAKRGGQGVPHP